MNHETLIRAEITCKKILSKISIKYTVLEIQFRSLKCRLLVGYAKISSNFPLSLKRYKAFTVCRCKQTTSKSFETFILYILIQIVRYINYSVADRCLTNSFSKISKIWLILWIYILAMWKGSKKLKEWVKSELTLHRWPRSSEMSNCSRPFQCV